MMVSTKGRYALRVMTELAMRETDRFVSLRELAEYQQISEKYLEIIMKSLVKAGIVIGLRGKGGGYRMGKVPEECSLAEILRATEGSLAPVACLEEGAECPRREQCVTLPIWQGLDELIDQYFQGITLAQLVEQARQAGQVGHCAMI